MVLALKKNPGTEEMVYPSLQAHKYIDLRAHVKKTKLRHEYVPATPALGRPGAC